MEKTPIKISPNDKSVVGKKVCGYVWMPGEYYKILFVGREMMLVENEQGEEEGVLFLGRDWFEWGE